jgi:hypothetical protein
MLLPYREVCSHVFESSACCSPMGNAASAPTSQSDFAEPISCMLMLKNVTRVNHVVITTVYTRAYDLTVCVSTGYFVVCHPVL